MARLKEYDGHYCESEYEYAFNVSACEGNPNRIQKAMVVCSNRKIAYELLQKFQDKYSECCRKEITGWGTCNRRTERI